MAALDPTGPVGLDAAMQLSYDEYGPDRVVASLEVTDVHHQPYGIVHGGVYCAMAETTASIGAALAARERAGSDDAGAVGQSNHTEFLRATRSGRLTATATPVHVGGTVQVWSVDVRDDDDRPVARSTVRLLTVGVGRMSGG